MKKLLTLCTASLIITGCTTQQPTLKTETTVHYVCPMDTNFAVAYSVDGETATLFDAADRVFILRQSVAASGALYKNDQGVSIHEKNGKLLVSLVPNRFIECTEFKQKK